MIHYRTCCLCEANCGLEIEHDGSQIQAIRGNPRDVLSQGYLCPKATALRDLHEDPDRLRQPMRREGSQWVPVSWEEAIEETASRLHQIQQQHGRHAVATYVGNPNAHSYTNLLALLVFRSTLATRHHFSATSADQLPHMFAAFQMFGHQLLLPVPDVDRTDLMIIVGGNPVVSNGSIMTAPNMRGRIKAIQQRGGTVITIDPRRTETARLADQHIWIRPGTDALLFLSMLHLLFAEDRIDTGPWRRFSDGLDAIEAIARRFPPERITDAVGISPDTIRHLTRTFSDTPRAVLYGRLGICTQAYGGLSAWLLNVLNLVTGHLDQPGGMMFPQPAVDLSALTAMVGQSGRYNTRRSRVRGLPEFAGEMPVSVLSEEMETPGDGQIRAFITVAGNPVLSTPNGQRLAENLERLDFMVSLDSYITATTRHAHIIFPPPSQLERDHFALIFHGLAVRNTVKYDEPLFDPPPDAHHDWQTLLALGRRINQKRKGLRARRESAKFAAMQQMGMQRMLSGLLFTGRYGPLRDPLGHRLTLRKLQQNPQGIDLGPLQPCLPERLYTSNKMIHIAPDVLCQDVERLEQDLEQGVFDTGTGLLLIGRRHLHSNNSWMHNVSRMVRGKPRCTLLMHPDDAAARDLSDGQEVVLSSRVGEVEVTLSVTDEMMPGVVSLPHGWGHRDKGAQLQVANTTQGASANDVTDDAFVDPLTGNAGLNGVRVEVRKPEVPA